jgi:acetyl-CoA carboxylase carboxyl transferase subunit alpha
MASQVLEFEKPILELEARIEELETFSASKSMDLTAELNKLRTRLGDLQRDTFSNLTPWQQVQLGRHGDRPQSTDYIKLMVANFVELKGDKAFRDDGAMMCGLATIGDRKVMLIGHRRGKHTEERIACNFGSAHPEGYRKAIKKMQLAERFNLPVVTLIDTMGAYPGIEAEERGQAQAIADSLLVMSRLKVPIITVVIGEGGSGGAIGIGLGDRLLILQNAFYSVISPEGCAAILWKDASKSEDAAKSLRLTSSDLMELGIADEVVDEPLGGAHRNHQEMADLLGKALERNLMEVSAFTTEELLQKRYDKYRQIGFFAGGKP